jgi:hypothetical protein
MAIDTQTATAHARMADELRDLAAEEDPACRPTSFAVSTLAEYLDKAAGEMGDTFPFGYIMDNGSNGTRVEWENNGKHVRVVVSPEPGGLCYVYHECGQEHDAEDLTQDTLARWLRWFIAPASTTPASTTPASTTPASTTPASTTPASTTPASTTPASTTPEGG